MKATLPFIAAAAFSFIIASPSSATEADELQIYRVLFEDAASPGGLIKAPGGLVIFRPLEAHEMQVDDELKTSLRKEFKGVENSTIEDFAKAQQKPPILRADSDVGFKITVLTEELYNEVFSERNVAANWQRFRERFGTRDYIQLSRVGFNKQGTQAMVYFGTGQAGHTVYLKKQKGKWIKIASTLNWVA